MRFGKTRQGYLELELSTEANWHKFEQIAKRICIGFHGKIVEKVDGIDEIYWDIKIDEALVTLHLQHYLGILVFANDEYGEKIIREIGLYLENSCFKLLKCSPIGIKPITVWSQVRSLPGPYRRTAAHCNGAPSFSYNPGCLLRPE